MWLWIVGMCIRHGITVNNSSPDFENIAFKVNWFVGNSKHEPHECEAVMCFFYICWNGKPPTFDSKHRICWVYYYLLHVVASAVNF